MYHDLLRVSERAAHSVSLGCARLEDLRGLSTSSMPRLTPLLCTLVQTTSYELKGPKPERFKVASGQLLKLAGASVPLLTRGGMGALTAGYKPSLVDKEEGTYTLFSTGNRQLKEESKVSCWNVTTCLPCRSCCEEVAARVYQLQPLTDQRTPTQLLAAIQPSHCGTRCACRQDHKQDKCISTALC